MIRKIIIVGGGTAGCISALMLKTKFPHIEIQIIESNNVGIVGVGESSTEHWTEFCSFVGINQLDAVLHCNATFKSGVYFENWAEEDFMHNLALPMAKNYGDYFGVYAHLISHDCSPLDLCHPFAYVNEVGTDYFNNFNDSPTNQFHFDTFALNKFLHNECIKRNITITTDDLYAITTHELTEKTRSVVSQTQEYFADFFIDCTGFSGLIVKNTYKIPWRSYSKYLPVNSAIAFATDEMEEYNKYTKATARNAGWSWTIPTQTRTGNGYVYCDAFITEDQAHQEMEESYRQKLEISRQFRFDPGRLEKAWYKNCYAVGLSQSFVEPLEATSIGSIIQQMFCFMHFLPSQDDETCNRHVNNIFDNIIDYVQAHYLIKKENTPFWKEVKHNLVLTENLQNYLEQWKYRLPLLSDITCSWAMFNATNYIPILYGLGKLNIHDIKNEYFNFYAKTLSNEIESELKSKLKYPMFPTSHKKFIKEIINKNIYCQK